MIQQEYWSKKHGDNYRHIYGSLTFEQKQKVTNAVLTHYFQVSDDSIYFEQCLNKIPDKKLTVIELGGYDGYQAQQIQEENPGVSWHNYDISAVAKYLSDQKHHGSKYIFHLLNKPFWDAILPKADVFYTSKTIEHLTLNEVKRVLEKTQNCKWQIHIIDWFWDDDMHVIEGNQHKQIISTLKKLHYKILESNNMIDRSYIFAVKV